MRKPRTFIPTINDRLEVRMVPSGAGSTSGLVIGYIGTGGSGGTAGMVPQGSNSGSGSTSGSTGG